VRYTLTILRTSLQRAVEAGLVHRNVARLVHPPRQDKEERQPFTPQQVTARFAATRDDSIGPLVVLSATTGLRQGEALALQWGDGVWVGVRPPQETLVLRPSRRDSCVERW